MGVPFSDDSKCLLYGRLATALHALRDGEMIAVDTGLDPNIAELCQTVGILATVIKNVSDSDTQNAEMGISSAIQQLNKLQINLHEQ